MRNRLFLAFLTLIGGAVLGLQAQEVKVLSDVTSKLANADFSADQPVTEMICTYDYDMAKNNSTLFGQQPVTGWTASNPTDNTLQDNRTDGANAKAAGIFALLDPDAEDGPGLGSTAYKAPFANEDAAAAGVTGPVLGMVAVWGGDFRYSQTVTLPAGDYMLLITYINTGTGTDITKNNSGFTAEDGTAYMSERKTFPVNEWAKDTVIFRLTAETAGQISIGLKGDGGSGSAAHLFIDNVKLYQIETNFIDYKSIEAAKANLLALIEQGEKYDVDVTASYQVYNNPNATLEQVLAAIENQKTLNEAATTDLSEFFISNPKFSQGSPVVGGICTYAKDCASNNISDSNFSMLDVPGWTQSKKDDGAAAGVFAVGSDAFLGGTGYLPPQTLSDGVTKEANLLGVVTCWSMAAQYTQNVTLPAGKYTVSISYYNSGGAGAVDKNLNGFIAEDGTEYLGEIKTYTVGKWLKEDIEFTLDEQTSGYFSLGYKSTNSGSGSMPHLFVDGFSLIYVGTGIDPSMLALDAVLNQGYKLQDETFNQDLYDQLSAALEVGQGLKDGYSTDSEANKAAALAISELFDDVRASIAAYSDLRDFLDGEMAQAIEKYDETNYPDLNEQLFTLYDEADEAYSNGSWSNEQIQETIASLPTIIKTGVQKLWDEAVASGQSLAVDLDITDLFEQMNYTYSTSAQQGASVPDKEWNYGSASNFKTQYGTAEVWNQSPFTVSRTLSNLPAGRYTISTKAFFRNADNSTNYTNWDPANTPEANLFAGSVKVGLTNVADIASDEEVEGWNLVEDVYLPNNQQTAYGIFNDDKYTAALQKSVSTVLTSTGDLTFGITADEMQSNSWVIWYGFTLTYNAFDSSDLYAVLQSLDKQATILIEEVGNVAKANDKLNDVMVAFGNVSETSPAETLKALVAQYEEAFAYADEAKSLVTELKKTYDLYVDYLMAAYVNEGNSSDDPAYPELLGEIDAAFDDGFDSNEQIKGYINSVKKGWVVYVQYPVLEDSSEENPGNITPVIYNNSFVDPMTNENNANGWTIEFTGGKTDKSYEVFEFYNNEKFLISQTIDGLEEGYYRVRVQSFYRSANTPQDVADSLTIDPEYGKYVQLFAQTPTSDRWTTVRNIFQREAEDGTLDTESLGVDGEKTASYGDVETFYVPGDRYSFHSYAEYGFYWNQVDVHVAAGESLTLGLRKPDHYVTGDWCPFDNFELYYLGKVAPTAVEAVEADGVATANGAEAIYNLAGQRVSKAVKGLYIVNGKKILVK